jgi:tripartite-type tricarboxylate transporter receptor subunit TctC
MTRILRADRRAVLAAALLAAFAAATPSHAQGKYPERPVTFIVPFAAGSATDQLARALGASITADTKQAVIVDNKAGASGMLAAQAAARAPADGYTVLITTNTTHAANEHLYKKLSYDPVKDFVPVTGLGKGGQVLVVRPDAPYKSVADLLAKAKKEPGKLSFGSGSSSSRVAGEMFKQLSGTEILHVPYKSNPQALTDLLGGQIDMMITDTATGVPQIKGGKLKALGVSTTKRIALCPTCRRSTRPASRATTWATGSPPTCREHAGAGGGAACASCSSRARRAPRRSSSTRGTGTDAWTTASGEELARFQAAEAQKWGKVIKARGSSPSESPGGQWRPDERRSPDPRPVRRRRDQAAPARPPLGGPAQPASRRAGVRAPVGIRLNGKERFDVEEYCLSEGWVKVPAGKTLDRHGPAAADQAEGNGRSVSTAEGATASGGLDPASRASLSARCARPDGCARPSAIP